MADIAELPEQARQMREMAARARRLARGLPYHDDGHARLIQHAEELEAKARDLERQFAAGHPATSPAASSAPPVQQQQVQQQQQHEAEPDEGEQKPSRPVS